MLAKYQTDVGGEALVSDFLPMPVLTLKNVLSSDLSVSPIFFSGVFNTGSPLSTGGMSPEGTVQVTLLATPTSTCC